MINNIEKNLSIQASKTILISFDEDVNFIVWLFDEDFAFILNIWMSYTIDFAQSKFDIYTNFMNYLIIIVRRRFAIWIVQIIWLHEQRISQLQIFIWLRHVACNKFRIKQNTNVRRRRSKLLSTSFYFCFVDSFAQ